MVVYIYMYMVVQQWWYMIYIYICGGIYIYILYIYISSFFLEPFFFFENIPPKKGELVGVCVVIPVSLVSLVSLQNCTKLQLVHHQ